MAITIQGPLDGNVVDISPETLANGHGLIELRESGSRVAIGADCAFTGSLHIIAGPRSTITIGARTRIGHVFLFSEHDAQIAVGADVIFNGSCRIMAHEPARITVGDGCLFASEINVMASDMHSIFSTRTGRRLNPARDIAIGNRVWIGDRVAVLKGAAIGDGSIVGYAAVVSKAFKKNCLLAGVPAKVVNDRAEQRAKSQPAFRPRGLLQNAADLGLRASAVKRRAGAKRAVNGVRHVADGDGGHGAPPGSR